MKYIFMSFFVASSMFAKIALFSPEFTTEFQDNFSTHAINSGSDELKTYIVERMIEMILFGVSTMVMFSFMTKNKNKFKIDFYVPRPANVQITMIDPGGNESSPLVNEFYKPGNYKMKWNACKYRSGIYTYRIKGEGNDYNFFKEVKVFVMHN